MGPLLLAALLEGCASGPSGGGASSSGNSQVQETPAAQQSVTVQGNVARPQIPWQDGLTLMQAFVLSGYQGDAKPAQLGIIRKKQMPIFMDYQKLYDGQDMLLEPGDKIVISP